MLSLKGMRRLFVPALVTVSTKSAKNRGADNSLKMEYLEIPSDPVTFNRQAAESASSPYLRISLQRFAGNSGGDKLVTGLKCESSTTIAHETDNILTTRCQTRVAALHSKTSSNPASSHPAASAETPYSQLKGVLKPQFLP